MIRESDIFKSVPSGFLKLTGAVGFGFFFLFCLEALGMRFSFGRELGAIMDSAVTYVSRFVDSNRPKTSGLWIRHLSRFSLSFHQVLE